MTLKQLKDKVRIDGPVLHGYFNYSILYRGSWEHTASNDTLAYDTIQDDENTRAYTLKQAYQVLWDKAARRMVSWKVYQQLKGD